VLGIVGRNGAGKSTLLKILSRITEPTTGCAKIRKKVGSLLEVGTGFHQELTGRENVYLNGAILGMSRSEIDSKFDEIIRFAEVEKFLDTPVKHYSSGMSVRLAFAVAAHLNTDILLIDEVLAVGDAGFQRKCTSLLRNSIADGRTAIIVSHNMGLIRTLCSRVIMLENGQIHMDGSPDAVINTYYQHVLSGEGTYKAGTNPKNRSIFVTAAYLSDLKGMPIHNVGCGTPFRLNLQFSSPSDQRIERPKIHIRINSSNGEYLSFLGSGMAGFKLTAIGNQTRVVCELENPNLGPGEYYIGFTVADGQTIYDHVENAVPITITTADYFGSGDLPQARHGRILLKSRWWTEKSGVAAMQNS
jgi:lipopolysaccharide transport system ATP-binding protein